MVQGFNLSEQQCLTCQMPLMEKGSDFLCVVCPVLMEGATANSNKAQESKTPRTKCGSRKSKTSSKKSFGGGHGHQGGTNEKNVPNVRSQDAPAHHDDDLSSMSESYVTSFSVPSSSRVNGAAVPQKTSNSRKPTLSKISSASSKKIQKSSGSKASIGEGSRTSSKKTAKSHKSSANPFNNDMELAPLTPPSS